MPFVVHPTPCVDLQAMLSEPIDLAKATRIFIRSGVLTKLGRRCGSHPACFFCISCRCGFETRSGYRVNLSYTPHHTTPHRTKGCVCRCVEACNSRSFRSSKRRVRIFHILYCTYDTPDSNIVSGCFRVHIVGIVCGHVRSIHHWYRGYQMQVTLSGSMPYCPSPASLVDIRPILYTYACLM